MAKQFKMTKNGETVYPQTITDAIADVSRKKNLTDTLSGIEDDAQLQNATTVTAQVGKVPVGAKYDANTPVSSIIADILAFATPTFSTLAINDGTKDYSASTNVVFCDSKAMSFQAVKHAESNVGSIKGKVTLNINGTKSDQTPSATVASVATDKVFTCSANKASFFVELTGTNTLSAPITTKRVTITAYMPVYVYVIDSPTADNAKKGLASAINEDTIFTGSKKFEKLLTLTQNQAICIATPSHLTCSRLCNNAADGFLPNGMEKTEISASRTVNGIADVPYTIYMTSALGATSELFNFTLNSK